MNLNNPLIYLINFVVIFVIGFFLGRFLKERGKIRCPIFELEIRFEKHHNKYPHSVTCNYEEAESGSYNIKLGFFNEKDVQIALTNPSVIFERKNKKKIFTTVKPEVFHFDITEGFNLPPRELYHCGWHGKIKKESGELENVLKSNKVFFIGYLPNGNKVKILILKELLYSPLKDSYGESVKIKK